MDVDVTAGFTESLFFCSPSSFLPNLSVSFLYLHMSFPSLQCLANGDVLMDILLIYLCLEPDCSIA